MPLFVDGQPAMARGLVRAAFPLLRTGMRRKLTIDAASAEHSRERTRAAMDRLERELGPEGYLVGDSFTVADLTAAALFYPVVRPSQFPYPSVSDPPLGVREFLDGLAGRPGGEWVAEMYRRHRDPAAAATLS
jgi:glutathione S-transferase